MECIKTKVQVVGNYLEALERSLRYRGIFFESVISGISPLAMEGSIIEDNLKYCSEINHLPTILNLRKNLSQMLSRDSENFCQNYNIQPAGKEVRYFNSSEYFILMNTSASYFLFEKDGVVYSDTYPQNPFLNKIKSSEDYKCIKYPYPCSFNWKYYYDKFINAILKEYDHSHIILIRTNSAQWYMENNEIKQFGSRSSQYRNMIEQLDEYFIEKTNCLCIDEQYAYIPNCNNMVAFPFAVPSEFTYKQFEHAILDIIKNKKIIQYETLIINGNPFERVLLKRLSTKIIQENEKEIKQIHDKWLSLDDISKCDFELPSKFFADIIKLKKFLSDDNSYTLSDYAMELLEDIDSLSRKIDIEAIALYNKYFKLDINDVIAVFMIYSVFDKKDKFKNIILNIIENSSCLPIIKANRFKRDNIDYLNKYQYIQPELKQKNDDNNRVYIRLESNNYIVIDKVEKTMNKVKIDIKKSINYSSVIESGYTCSIECSDALCSNLAFYIERAKRGQGNVPIRVTFSSTKEFCETLNYIDYVDILDNENYAICLEKSDWSPANYSARCNLEFLFDDNLRICHLGNGLNDQIKFYVLSKIIQERIGGKIYYDDVYSFYYQNSFSGDLELKNVTKEKIDNNLLSNLFSVKLLESFVEFFKKKQKGPMSLPLLLRESGLEDMVCVYNAREYDDRYLSIKVNSGEKRFDTVVLQMFKDIRLTYYHLYCQLYELTDNIALEIKKYLSFPPFDDYNNISIKEKLLSSDSVVMHIRRGDFIPTLCGNNDPSKQYNKGYAFYREAMQKLLAIEDYPNKKYFVFSDDIPWCQENTSMLGLDLVKDSEIIFVSHNKGENSFRDMQLMMYGKIMIISQSGFATNAAYCSNRCEVLMPIGGKITEKFIKAGKKYKYNVEPFTNRGMFENWG